MPEMVEVHWLAVPSRRAEAICWAGAAMVGTQRPSTAGPRLELGYMASMFPDTRKFWVPAVTMRFFPSLGDVKPELPELPKLSAAGKKWVRNGLDYFVAHRLEKEGLPLSPEASRETLIRRVTLDLTGLPPTPEEVDAFLAELPRYAQEAVPDSARG